MAARTPDRTIGLLLAAGASRRFGAEDKLLADLGGKPLVLHAADAMRAAAFDARLAVTSSAEVAVLLPDFEIAPVNPGAPQSASLRAGIRCAIAMGATRVVVALGDMPRVPPGLLAEIAHHPGPACAGDGARRTPPAAFPAELFESLLAATGDRGAGALLADLPESAVIATAPETLIDIDRPEDLARLQKNA
ncbi:nucleotidyltransferase family protein [Ovoidimarina sediminis]|uniref:nucleotidyltransferase family protein n=1 Tax=Ovoidimarina sediminis TaxID=3079856 RepID=UPI0029134475|nr:nucleotidyltransferase family protein [Rhodophyticola sp. MJ-SS7]MDU8942863.1 nucleotidyltransferase family protein [Rhodophyticola sp. MJ-SS7]